MGSQRKDFDWFKLENYASVKNFTFGEWRQVIEERVSHSFLLTAPDDAFHGYSPETLALRRSEIVTYWETIRNCGAKPRPLRNYREEMSVEQNERLNLLKSLFFKEKNNIGVIKDLTEFDIMLDLFDRENFYDLVSDFNDFKEVRESWYRTWQQGDPSGLVSREKFKEKYQSLIAHENMGVIQVNLSASDEQLKDNFSSWLVIQRQRDPEQRTLRITQRDLDDWATANVLPYFDLINICSLDGTRISNHLMGDLLFPHEIDVDVSERIRKVTKHKVKKIFSGETMDLLDAQKIEGFKTERKV